MTCHCGVSTTYTSGAQVPDIDPGDLDHIEVLRGPQGTLYGANSMGGLVKYVTVDPSTMAFSGRLEAGTSGASHGAEPGYSLRAAYNVPVTDSLAVRVSGYERQDPGYIDNPTYHLSGVNETKAYGARMSALWSPSEDFSLKLGAVYQRLQAGASTDVNAAVGSATLQQTFLPGSSVAERGFKPTARYSRLSWEGSTSFPSPGRTSTATRMDSTSPSSSDP